MKLNVTRNNLLDAGQWFLIIIGIVLVLFFYWVGTHDKSVKDRDEEDLDDWDQQDQLEGDQV
jgi:hypothetical protein